MTTQTKRRNGFVDEISHAIADIATRHGNAMHKDTIRARLSKIIKAGTGKEASVALSELIETPARGDNASRRREISKRIVADQAALAALK